MLSLLKTTQEQKPLATKVKGETIMIPTEDPETGERTFKEVRRPHEIWS